MNHKDNPKLKSLFARSGVLFAYLFGSQAEGRAVKSSDIDIAVFLKSSSKKDRFVVRLKLIVELEKLFSPTPVDVIVLNDVHSVTLRYSVITEGRLLYEKDEGKRLDFELFTWKEYEEFSPFLKVYNKAYLQAAL